MGYKHYLHLFANMISILSESNSVSGLSATLRAMSSRLLESQSTSDTSFVDPSRVRCRRNLIVDIKHTSTSLPFRIVKPAEFHEAPADSAMKSDFEHSKFTAGYSDCVATRQALPGQLTGWNRVAARLHGGLGPSCVSWTCSFFSVVLSLQPW